MSTEPEAVQTEPAASGRRVPWGEWALTAGVLAIGVVVLLDGLGQRASSSASGVGAGFMPKIVGVLLIVLALALAVEVARGHLGEAETAEGDVDVRHTKWVPLGVCIGAALVFIAGIEQLGYVIVSTVAFWLTAWAMGVRRHLRSALIAVVLSVVVYIAFTRLLEIDLPAGVLEGIL